jgi:uncharacterized protein YceK
MQKLILTIAMLPLLSGCGTFVARTGWRHEVAGIPQYYPATVVDAQFIASPFYILIDSPSDYYESPSTLPRVILGCLVGVVDLPISLVTDTVCIPVDMKTKNEESNQPSEVVRQQKN